MKIFDLYKNCSSLLRENNIEDYDFEARLITENACGIDHGNFLLERYREASAEEIDKAFNDVKLRISGIPVQYIIGKWEFMGLEFSVGEGVLIPRPETEELCEFIIDKIKDNEKTVVFDLCSGTGCIGLSLKHFCKNADLYMVEKSDEALKYLEKNRSYLGFARNTVCVKGDILKGYEDGFSFLPKPDVIVSNPPYIRASEIPDLQKEVLKEPLMALDGGEDGFIFYRCLSDKWLAYIIEGGFIAVECGEGQAEEIASMFLEHATETQIIKDVYGTDRLVVAYK